MTDSIKAKIKSLFDNLPGADGETGLKIVIYLITEGFSSNKQVAAATGLSTKTVSRYRGTKTTAGYYALVKNDLLQIF